MKKCIVLRDLKVQNHKFAYKKPNCKKQEYTEFEISKML